MAKISLAALCPQSAEQLFIVEQGFNLQICSLGIAVVRWSFIRGNHRLLFQELDWPRAASVTP